MPCYPYESKNSAGFICSLSDPPMQKCYVCGRPAICLCDYRGLEAIYPTDQYGSKLAKEFVPRLHQCSRPMCHIHSKHIDPDEDYCDLHSSEIAIIRSRKAEALHRERCLKHGIDLSEIE